MGSREILFGVVSENYSIFFYIFNINKIIILLFHIFLINIELFSTYDFYLSIDILYYLVVKNVLFAVQGALLNKWTFIIPQ